MYQETKIIRIGSQELYVLPDRARFNIGKVIPARGFKFSFSLRDRVLKEALHLGKPLEVVFTEFPGISIMHNPLKWQNLGKKMKQIGHFQNNPMTMYFYNVDFRDEVSKQRQPEGQVSLL